MILNHGLEVQVCFNMFPGERSAYAPGNCPWIMDDWHYHHGSLDENKQRCRDQCTEAKGHNARLQTYGYSSLFCVSCHRNSKVCICVSLDDNPKKEHLVTGKE